MEKFNLVVKLVVFAENVQAAETLVSAVLKDNKDNSDIYDYEVLGEQVDGPDTQ